MSCFSFYEWSTAIELAGYTFAGSNDNGMFDTPIFQSMEIDDNSVPIGRLQGEFYVDDSGGAVGQSGIHFFESDSWIVAAFGFNNAVPTDPLPHAILAGTGDYEGIIGTFSSTVVATDPNFIIEYEVCPGEAAPPLPACSPAYEWSTAGNFTTLAGTSLQFGGSNFDTGVFDTPLFPTAEVDADGALAVGANKGHFSAAGDINLGEWNVVLVDQESSSLAASTGFTDSAKIFPNVVTGGTGMFLGAVGTFESVVVAEDPNFVIEWKFCPQEPVVLDECVSIYERSGAFTHDAMTFSGLSDAGDFETPMWATLAAAIAADTTPDGVVIGAFYNRKNVNPGDWNFGFFDDGSWVSARAGFGDDPTPDVITGGSGRFAGITGTVTECVEEEDPFIIRFDICPFGAEIPGCGDQPIQDPCLVCPGDADVTKPDAMVPIPGGDPVSCADIQMAGRNALIPAAMCVAAQLGVPSVCGCGDSPIDPTPAPAEPTAAPVPDADPTDAPTDGSAGYAKRTALAATSFVAFTMAWVLAA